MTAAIATPPTSPATRSTCPAASPSRHGRTDRAVRGPAARAQQHLSNWSTAPTWSGSAWPTRQDLFEISTPERAKAAPRCRVDGTTVVAGLRDTGLCRPGGGHRGAELDDCGGPSALGGGASDEVVDLTGGPGGERRLQRRHVPRRGDLPAAAGTQRVMMSGGASQFVVRLAGDRSGPGGSDGRRRAR